MKDSLVSMPLWLLYYTHGFVVIVAARIFHARGWLAGFYANFYVCLPRSKPKTLSKHRVQREMTSCNKSLPPAWTAPQPRPFSTSFWFQHYSQRSTIRYITEEAVKILNRRKWLDKLQKADKRQPGLYIRTEITISRSLWCTYDPSLKELTKVSTMQEHVLWHQELYYIRLAHLFQPQVGYNNLALLVVNTR